MRLLTALLSTTFALTSGGRTQVLPAGEFAARDGRPGPGKTWKLNDEQGHALAARVNAVAAQTEIVIDYDHQTLHAVQNGQPAPAAGWMSRVEWLDGKGMFADVGWTAPAKRRIDDREYRYFSPVITWDDDTGEVTGLLLGALVNYPALTGMEPVMAQLAAQFLQSPPPENDMALLAALLTALGLPADTPEAAALSSVSALRTTAEAAGARPVVPQALTTALGLAADATEAAALGAITTMQAGSASVTQSIAALHTQIAALTAQQTTRQVEELVDGAIVAGKMLPAARDTFIGIGKKDLAQLSAVVAAMPVIPGLAGQTGGKAPPEQQAHQQAAAALSSADAVAVASAMGIAPDAWQKSLPKSA